MATLTQFRARISAKLGLDNTVAGDQPAIDDWVNEGVADVLVRTRVKIQVGTMVLTSGSYDYTLATGILAIDDLFITDVASTQSRLLRKTPNEILEMRIRSSQGTPPVLYYAENGGLLMVYPTPAAADTITTYYVPRPVTLAAGADTPSEIPAEWHKAVEYFGLWQAGQYSNDAPSQHGAVYRDLYEQELKKIRKATIRRGGRKLSPAVIGHRSGVRFPIGSPSQQDV